MQSAFFKDVFREIKNTFGRFMGLFSIVALGVSFFAGVAATGSDMKASGDIYFDRQNLMDIRVVSTYGLNKKDITAISQVPGIRQIIPAYSIDAITHKNDASQILKIHSLNIREDQTQQMNRPVLLLGRMPEKANETLVETRLLYNLGIGIGDTITLESGKKSDVRNLLKTSTYKIVGTVQSPYYISSERGTGSIGKGTVDCYIYIPEENFQQDYYSEVFITVAGARSIMSYSDAYEDKVDKVIKAIEKVGDIRVVERMAEMTAKSYKRINQAEKELDTQEAAALALFNDTENELLAAEQKLLKTENSLPEKQNDITMGLKALDEKEAQAKSGVNEIQTGISDAEASRQELNASRMAIFDAEQELQEKKAQLEQNEAQLKKLYPSGSTQLEQALKEIQEGKAQILQMEAELEINKTEIDLGLAALESAQNALQQQLSVLNESIIQISKTRDSLMESQQSITDSNRLIARNKAELEKSRSEFEIEKKNTLNEIAQARVALQVSRKTLDDLKQPKWYVLDRSANAGYSSYGEDSDKIEAIGKVFPLIFFVVAALVSLTTMTRLVEERRTEIGTLKSLGYSNSKIMSKYLFYAATPTLLGGLAGGYFGMQLFPATIMNAYGSLYSLPEHYTLVNVPYWMGGIALALACTIFATVFSCMNELKVTPCSLMRPKAPKMGRKILFERIPVLWSSLSFNYKVTIRNIFRYKKRFFMTVIGISGSTALLMTGFGVKDSVSGIIDKQFGYVFHYDMVTSFADSAESKDISNVNEILSSNSIVRSSLVLKQKAIDAESEDGSEKASIIVPERIEDLYSFITLRDRVTGESVILKEAGVVVTEKLAKLLSINVGDTITIKDGDDVRAEAVVSGITENYFNHYIYLAPEYYQQIFNEPVDFNAIYSILSKEFKLAENKNNEINEMSDEILGKKNVNAVVFLEDTINTASKTIQSLNFVVLVLIISAGALAFVVLLNLTSINISERIRELATIEVLGFYDSEVAGYVYRENLILTAVGAGAGLALGYFLHLYVIMSAETALTMFSREIYTVSYLYSVALTFLFSISVNALTSGKLKKINMVEALKSIE